MVINHNIAALNSYGQLAKNQGAQGKSLEKLSSGLRINRAGDDAAGLAISEKMRGQIRGLDQASRNAQDGISLIQTAEGALGETHSILQRMRELSVQAGNDTLATEDRTAIATELDQLRTELGGIASRTKFNGQTLLDGNFGVRLDATSTGAQAAALQTITVSVNGIASGASVTLTVVDASDTITANLGGVTQTITLADVTNVSKGTVIDFDKIGLKMTVNFDATSLDNADFDGTVFSTTGTNASIQIGANGGANETLSIAIGNMTTGTNGLNLAGAQLDVTTSTNAQTTVANIDSAISKVSTERANLGAYQNRLEHTINSLAATSENLSASESRIRDVDMAKEMMEFTKNNILQQAATAMLAQANQAPQGVLQLLR